MHEPEMDYGSEFPLTEPKYRWKTSVEELERLAGIEDFDRDAWDWAADQGFVDTRGGSEYRLWLIRKIEEGNEGD